MPRIGLGVGLGAIGRAGTWTPSATSGLIFWLRADTGVTLVGSNVSAWTDMSSSALSVTQSTDANRPTIVSSDVNGRPGVRGAASARLDVSSFPTITAATFLLVLMRTSLASAYMLSGASGNFGIIEGFTGSALEWFSGGGTDRLTFAATPTAGAHVLIATQTNGGALTLYYDGAQVATKPTAGASLVAVQSIFNVTGGTTNGFDGDLLEMLTYSRVLSAGEIAFATAYAKTRYAIA